jgi:hypothetical protein
MNVQRQLLFSWLLLLSAHGSAQDLGLLFLKGSLPAAYSQAGLPLDEGLHIAAGNASASFATNGPSFNDVFKRNSLGQRYVDIRAYGASFPEQTAVSAGFGLRTLDVAYAWNSFSLMAGHGFRFESAFQYPKAMAELATFGNGPFVGREVNLGINADVNAYNEFSVGLQKKMGIITFGLRGKLLYGISSLKTDEASALFTTDEAFYAWNLTNSYTVRSSGLLRYYSLDSIDVNFKPLTFENVFFNNAGWGLDAGISVQLSKNSLITVGLQDAGSIRWDFFPRKYQSKGAFTFDGLDVFSSLGDTIPIQISDTLLSIIEVTSGIEEYRTKLNHSIIVSGMFAVGKNWTLMGSYTAKNLVNIVNHHISLGGSMKLKFLDVGASVNYSNFGYLNAGVFARLKLGAFSLYSSVDNPAVLFRPLDNKHGFIRLGTTLNL